MAVICWGNLGKTADDNTRIEQSIQDYVEDHNENPNAHQIEGSSLYMHRINEQLDHAKGSVDLSYLSKTKIVFMTSFETIDGWWVDAYQSHAGVFQAYIKTENTTDSEIAMWYAFPGNEPRLDEAKNPYWQIHILMYDITNVIVYIVCGNPLDLSQGAMFGFKIEAGKIYAIWAQEETAYSEEIMNAIEDTPVGYSCEIDSQNKQIKFYINGELKHTQDIVYLEYNIDVTFEIYGKTLANEYKTLYLIDHIFTQDK